MGIDADRASVVDIGLQIASYVSPVKNTKKRGTFIVGGGVLMTRQDMIDEIERIEAERAQKNNETEKRKCAREAARLAKAAKRSARPATTTR